MPKKNLFTPKGRSFQRKRKFKVSPKGFPKPREQRYGTIYVQGAKLNGAEAEVWFALERRNEGWRPHVKVGLNSGLGSGDADFESGWLRTIIEVDGPFHKGLVGEARDFFRTMVRKQAGYDVVRIPWPIPRNIDRFLRDKLGSRRR